MVALANSNTVPTSAVAAAALDIALTDVPLSAISGVMPDELGEGVAAMHALLPPVAGPVAETLTTSGPDPRQGGVLPVGRARAGRVRPRRRRVHRRDVGSDRAAPHKHGLALLRMWTELRPDSSAAWTMTGWAHQVDGHLDLARSLLQRAVDLDPDNHDAALIMSSLPSA